VVEFWGQMLIRLHIHGNSCVPEGLCRPSAENDDSTRNELDGKS
jgi:hypothetical protein